MSNLNIIYKCLQLDWLPRSDHEKLNSALTVQFCVDMCFNVNHNYTTYFMSSNDTFYVGKP